jgi:hypothetical protein
MMNEEITVIIDGSGQIEVETNGFTGSVCEKVVEQVVVGLGAQEINSVKKSSYYEDGDDPVKVLTSEG